MTREPLPLERARELVLVGLRPLPAERVPLAEALGRTLADDLAGSEPVPACDNSAMDGFAVRAADTAGAGPASPVSLRLGGESRAGAPAGQALEPGEAFKISTGAALPAGADAVVRIEETADAEREGSVEIAAEVEPGRDIRRAGEDIRVGDRVLAAGERIGPAELGVLASVGAAEVPVRRRPRVAVVGTGDELLDPDEPMRPGGVRDTNGWAVPALARLAGGEVVGRMRAGDEPEATRAAISRALDADVAVICGGVSVGPHDHVRPALAELGAEQRFWGVALRPGRPTWFGVAGGGPAAGGCLAFGLPGNPVSALVTFLLFARPALRALSGSDPALDRARAALDEGYEKPPGRAHALRVALTLGDDGWHARLTRPEQGSHVLTSMIGADALALVPAEADRIAPGERVAIELLPRP